MKESRQINKQTKEQIKKKEEKRGRRPKARRLAVLEGLSGADLFSGLRERVEDLVSGISSQRARKRGATKGERRRKREEGKGTHRESAHERSGSARRAREVSVFSAYSGASERYRTLPISCARVSTSVVSPSIGNDDVTTTQRRHNNDNITTIRQVEICARAPVQANGTFERTTLFVFLAIRPRIYCFAYSSAK